MQECNCKCSSVSYNVCPNTCYPENFCELDCIITNLKNELFEKMQNSRDCCSLEAKILKLQNDIKALKEEKQILECKIIQSGKEGDKMIYELRNTNENLKNQLNEKNILNKKLYGENNNLFQQLEGKTCDNQNLQDQMCHQENILSRLNSDKMNLKNTINNLNQVRDKHIKDIQDLSTEINILNKSSNDLDCTLKSKQSQNLQIINEFNSMKCVNTKLFNDLKEKECCLAKKQEELCLLNNDITRLQKELDNLNCLNQRTKDDIACTNNSLLKEISLKNNLNNENSKLNCLIGDRNSKIEKITNDNDMLKCSNTGNNTNNIFLNKKVEAYKKHILILTSQNEKLSAELESIICRDSQLLDTLGRDTYLRAVQYENKNVINSSLDCLQTFSKNKNCNLNCEKKYDDINIKSKDYKDYKDNNYGINFNQIGNTSSPISPMKNKTGLKLNMQYPTSLEEDLGPRNK